MKIRLSFRIIVLIRHILTCGECRKILKQIFSGKFVLVIDEETGNYWVEPV